MKNYHEKEIFRDLIRLFFDTSNRPKKTPLYESAIIRNLETKYGRSEISYALKKLENITDKRKLKKFVVKIKPIGNTNFYYPACLEIIEDKHEIIEKISRISSLIKSYSNKKITTLLGNHLHCLVKQELKRKNFEIVDEYTNTYQNKKWNDRHNLDIIASNKSKKLTVGIEIKNMLDDISKKEIDVKMNMCKTFGIVPVFACRFTRYEEYINENGGFCWNFDYQIYPINKMNFVKPLQGRLNLPILVSSNLPKHSRLAFAKWLRNN